MNFTYHSLKDKNTLEIANVLRRKRGNNKRVVDSFSKTADTTDDTTTSSNSSPSSSSSSSSSVPVRELFLTGNHLTCEGARCILEALKVNHTLRKLSLGENQIGCEVAPLVAEILSNDHPSLADLDLRYNKLDDHAGALIVSSLSTNTVLQALDLSKNDPNERVTYTGNHNHNNHNNNNNNNSNGSNNNGGDSDEEDQHHERPTPPRRRQRISNETAAALTRVLKVNSTLERMEFSSFGLLGDREAAALASALWNSNYSLKHLRMYINPHLTSNPHWKLLQLSLQRNQLEIPLLWQQVDDCSGIWAVVLARLSRSCQPTTNSFKHRRGTKVKYGLDLMYYIVLNKPGMFLR